MDISLYKFVLLLGSIEFKHVNSYVTDEVTATSKSRKLSCYPPKGHYCTYCGLLQKKIS